MKEQYEALARVYDGLMYDARYAEWGEYIVRLLCRGGVGKGRLIEYACGTGNITLELLKAGYRVVAVDASAEMLDAAQKKMRRHTRAPRFVCADMAGFRLNHPVQAAVCACDGVNYILEDVELRCFFSNVFANIAPGGVFLFDISAARKFSAMLCGEFFYDDGEERTALWRVRRGGEKNTVEMELALFLREGEFYRRMDEIHTQRAWEAKEIQAALEDVGFHEVCAYAFLTEERVEDDTERIQFAARKGDA